MWQLCQHFSPHCKTPSQVLSPNWRSAEGQVGQILHVVLPESMHRTAPRRRTRKAFILGWPLLCWIQVVSSWDSLYTVESSNWACPEGYLVKAPEQGCSLDQGRVWFVVVIFALGASPLWLWLLELPAAPLHHYAPILPPTLWLSVHISGKKPKFFRTRLALCIFSEPRRLWTRLSTLITLLSGTIVFKSRKKCSFKKHLQLFICMCECLWHSGHVVARYVSKLQCGGLLQVSMSLSMCTAWSLGEDNG